MRVTIEQSKQRVGKLPEILRVYWLVLISLLLLSAATSWVAHGIFHSHETAYSILPMLRSHMASDFTCYTERFRYFHQIQFFTVSGQPFTYPAPIAIVFEIFFGYFRHPERAFAAFCAAVYVLGGILFSRALSHRGVSAVVAVAFTATAMLASYPFQLMFFLLNIEVVVWALVALGIWLHVKKRPWHAAVCFGLAGSMKYFPLVYVGLLLARKQYWQSAFALVVCFVSTVGSLLMLGPTIPAAYHGLAGQLSGFRSFYILGFNRTDNGIDHSLFALIKLVLVVTHKLRYIAFLPLPYLAIAALVGCLLYFGRIRKLPQLNQVLALSVAAVLLPPLSHDYTLVHLYAPWAMFVFYALRNPGRKALWAVFACFAMLFSAQNFLVLWHDGIAIPVAGQAKALLLLVLFGIALVLEFPEAAATEAAIGSERLSSVSDDRRY